MIDPLSLASSTAGFGAGAGLAFFAIKWLFEYLGGRMDKRADRIDAGTDKLIAQLVEDSERNAATVEALRERVEKVELELIDCRRKHAESDAEVIRLNAKIAALEESR